MLPHVSTGKVHRKLSLPDVYNPSVHFFTPDLPLTILFLRFFVVSNKLLSFRFMQLSYSYARPDGLWEENALSEGHGTNKGCEPPS